MAPIFRRGVAVLLAAALVWLSPGLPAFQAAAAELARPAAEAPAVAPLAVSAAPLQAPGTPALGELPGLPQLPQAAVPSIEMPAPGAAASSAPPAEFPRGERPAPEAARARSTRVDSPALESPRAERTSGKLAEPAGRVQSSRRAAQTARVERADSVSQALRQASQPLAASPNAASARVAALFDGSRTAPERALPTREKASPRLGRARRAAAAAVLGLSLLTAGVGAVGRGVPAGLARAREQLLLLQAAPVTPPRSSPSASRQGPAAAAAAATPQAAAPQGQAAAPQAQAQSAQPADSVPVSQDVRVAVSVDRQGATVGERIHVSFSLTNTTQKPITIVGLKSSLEDVLPEDVELESGVDDKPITLPAGQTVKLTAEAIPFASGKLDLTGPLDVTVMTADGPSDVLYAVPPASIQVKTVLTPDWKQKGFMDIHDVLRKSVPQWAWLIAAPLLLLLLAGVERLLAQRREAAALALKRRPLVLRTRERLDALEKSGLDDAAFYGELYSSLSSFLVDYQGLPTRERDAASLLSDLKASKKYNSGVLRVAAGLADRAEQARFGGRVWGPDGRRRDLADLRALVDAVSGQTPDGAASPAAGVSGLQFGDPWALLMLLPLAAFAVWNWRHSRALRARQALAVASTALTRRRTLRERLVWLPRALRVAALAFLLMAVADPQMGVTRQETYTPSTDTMMELDVSGSMGDPYNPGGSGPTKLQAAEGAIKGYVEEQRRGTTNRVGLGTFADDPYVDVRLTTDYDALIAHLKQLHADGSTAIGKAILSGVAHFIELNIMELDDPSDPRVAQAKTILREKGLPAVLEYAKQYPDLMDKLVQPERKKIIVLFTDGQSNSGIEPLDAAQIAKQLGVRVYTVGIAPTGQSSGDYDEATLTAIAQMTGGQFYRADDAQRMAQVLLEISRLEKSPTRIVSAITVNDYSRYLYLLGALSFLLALGLGETRLRVLHGILAVSLAGGLGLPAVPVTQPAAAVRSVQYQQPSVPGAPGQSAQPLPVKGVPPDVAAANGLFNEGRYDEALRAYAQAAQSHPDMPELYFNMGNAYLRLGELDKARASYEKFIALTPDAKKASLAYYNMGNAALMKKDARRAEDMYKQALRLDAANFPAKWNLEILEQAQKQQQQQQQQKQNQNQRQKHHQKQQKNQNQQQQNQQQQNQQQQNQQQQNQQQQQQQQNQQQNQQQQQQQQNQQQQQSQQNQQNQKPQPQTPQQQKQERKQGLDKLQQELAQQQKEKQDAQRQNIPRDGSKIWGALGPLSLGGSTALTFGHPALAWAALALIPIAVALLAYGLRKRLKAARAVAPASAPRSFKEWWGRPAFLRKAGAAVLALALLGLAGADPRSGYRDERLNFGGKDVIVAADGSLSMVYAEDGRLAKTKAELDDFVSHLQGTDRIGLVVFAGQAREASPLSIDYSNFEFKLDRLDKEAVGLKDGTDLAGAIEFAAQSFENAKKVGDRQRVLIVISDGDIFGEDVQAAIDAARKHHVIVYTIGVGTPQGVRMKIPTADGSGTEYLQDAQTGRPALTRLHEKSLEQIAQATGGAYFRAGPHASMTRIMKQVAELQKGQKGDAIRSPRPVAGWFGWPALALLLFELLSASPSVLRRPADPRPKRKGGPGAAAGLLALPLLGGLSPLPLQAWPFLLPFSLVLTAVAAAVLYDVRTRGALSRRLTWAWQRRRGLVERGASADATRLFEGRDVDLARLRAFADAWQASSEPAKRALLAEAAADPQLWREKLVWACLAAEEPSAREAAFAALARGQRLHLEAVAPVLMRVFSRRASFPWLYHVDAAKRLSRLAAAWLSPKDEEQRRQLVSLARFPDQDVAAIARQALGDLGAPVVPPGRRRERVWRGVATALLVSMLAGSTALTGRAGYGSYQYWQAGRQAADATSRIFYGEDVFVFHDHYADDRIPQDVLPALKRWSGSTSADSAQFTRALRVLAESPDPKADNILEVLLKHADLLPLDADGQNLLLKTLVERNNDQVWKFLDLHLARTADNPRMVELMKRMVVIAATSDNERAVQNAFHFLKSPNDDLRTFAQQRLYAALASQPDRFFTRLLAVQQRLGSDPEINAWTLDFALLRLAQADPAQLDSTQAKQLLDAVVDAAAPVDSVRVQILTAFQKQQQQQQQAQVGAAAPGAAGPQAAAGPKLPPPYLAELYQIMEQVAEQSAQRPGADGKLPAPLAAQLQASVDRTATKLIQEAEKDYPGLHEKLIAAGIVLPDTQGYSDYYDEYEGRGDGSSTDQNYRTDYKLQQLRRLGEMIAGAQAEAGKDASPAQLEFSDRAQQTLQQLVSVGQRAGMPEGNSPAELAADLANPVVAAGAQVFDNSAFEEALKAKLAPTDPDVLFDGKTPYRDAYSFEDLSALRAFVADIAQSGALDVSGGRVPLTFKQKEWVVGALTALDGALAQVYPAQAKPAASDEAALWRAVQDPAQRSLAAARVAVAQQARSSDVDFQLRVIARLAQEPLASADPAELAEVLKLAAACAQSAGRGAEELSALARAVRAAGPKSSLAAAARGEVQRRTAALIGAASSAFPGLMDRLIEDGVRQSSSQDRDAYTLAHIARFERDLEARARAGQLDADQAKAAQTAHAEVAALLELGRACGVPAGDSRAERLADGIGGLVARGAALTNGSGFTDALRAAGLDVSVMTDGSTSGTPVIQNLTEKDALVLREVFAKILASGRTWDYSGAPRAMSMDEKAFFAAGLDRIDAMLADPRTVDSPDDGAALLRRASEPSLRRDAPARLFAASERRPGDAAFQIEVLRAAGKLARAKGAPLDAADLQAVVDKAFDMAPDSARAQLLTALADAAAGAKGPLAAAARARFDAELHSAVDDVHSAFPDLNDSLDALGVMGGPSYVRDAHFTLLQAARLRQLVDARAQKGALRDDQKAAAALVDAETPVLISLGRKAGAPAGTSPQEQVAGPVNAVLFDGYLKFPGHVFVDALQAAGLEPGADAPASLAPYHNRYTKAQVAALRKYLADLLASGQGWDSELSSRRPLTVDEKDYLNKAIARLDDVLAHYPSAPAAVPGLLVLGVPALGLLASGTLPPFEALSALWPLVLIGGTLALVYWFVSAYAPRATAQEEAPRRSGVSEEAVRRARRVELAARVLASSMAPGSFRSRFLGLGGTDLVDARKYEPGDDVQHIDWKASARVDELMTKRYELEKDMPLMLVVDVSGSSAVGTREVDKRTVAEDSAALLAFAAARQNIRVGALLVTDRVELAVPPRTGLANAEALVRLIQGYRSKSTRTDLRPALDQALKSLKSRAMVAVISDFIAPDFRDDLVGLSRRHDVRLFRVVDPLETRPMPDVGLVRLRDAETGELRELDTSGRAAREDLTAEQARREAQLVSAAAAARTRIVDLPTDSDYLAALQEQFNPKRKTSK